MPKTKAIIKIQNVVASATLNQKIDLNAVVKSYPGVEYRPEQFPGLVFRLKKTEDGDADFQLWQNGVHRSEIGTGIPQGCYDSC